MAIETTSTKATTAGNYFVSNYPPFSFWRPEYVPDILEAFDSPPEPETPLGLYVHIPFCRKRCHFCYFKVYTDKNSQEIRTYLDYLIREVSLYAEQPFIGDRKLKYVYFGGGTPSYLSAKQLDELTKALKAALPWDEAEEVTFECEPGTLTETKLKAIRAMGVTRLSLGIENYDDKILEINGRAHRSEEIGRAYDFARSIEFPQINIDLISGMIGETDANWTKCVQKTLALHPDSITIYQMEIPYNTTIYQEMKEHGDKTAPVADWDTKRRWVREAFSALEEAGYTIGSAYTAVRDPNQTKFVYRDELWKGADMISLGVASFGHVAGRHFQNEKDNGPYFGRLDTGNLPIHRAYRLSDEERLIREFALQLKLGRVDSGYFKDKFDVEIKERFAEPLASLEEEGYADLRNEEVRLTREGLLRVDWLLPRFFLPEHVTDRYV
jgi:oxygen-independent coproporphyrinogen-3 oxidase